MNVNFKANYILQTTIKEIKTNNVPKDKKVSFIEFNPLNESDINCLSTTAFHWQDSKFAMPIYNDAFIDNNWHEKDEIVKKYYALTKQMDNFNQPKSNKILGLVEIEQIGSKLGFIHFLQVKPAFMWNSLHSKYKHIGSSILNAIERICQNKTILLEPEEGTEPFYLKNGFIKIKGNSNMMFKKCK